MRDVKESDSESSGVGQETCPQNFHERSELLAVKFKAYVHNAYIEGYSTVEA